MSKVSKVKTEEKRLFLGANLTNPATWGYEGTEKKLRQMYQLNDCGLIKGPPGSGKGTFMQQIADNIIFANQDRVNYMCSGTLEARDGIVFPDVGIGYIDATRPHLVEPTAPQDRVIDLFQSVIPDKAPSQEQIDNIIKRRLEYYAESSKAMAEVVNSRDPYKTPNPKEVKFWFERIDKMLSNKGIEPISKNIVGFKKAVTSGNEQNPEGIVDYADTWADKENTFLIPASEEISDQVFRLLHLKYGNHAFLHYLEPGKLFEGVYIGGQMIKQYPGFEKPIDQAPLKKAVTALGGADIIMHQEIEGLYKNAIDYEKNNKLIRREIARHSKTVEEMESK